MKILKNMHPTDKEALAAIAVLLGDKVSPIMPEPITVAKSMAVPKNSDK